MVPYEVKKPYFLLQQPEAIGDELFNSLLGRAVTNPCDPVYGTCRPRYPVKPRDAIDYLYPPQYIVCTDFNMVTKTAANARIESRLQSLVKLSLQKGHAWEGEMSAAGFRRIKMHNAATMIEDLLKTPTNDASSKHNEAGHEAAQLAWTPPQPAPTDGRSSITPLLAAALAPAPNPNPIEEAAQRTVRAEYRKQVLELLREQKDGMLYIITGFITCTGLTRNQERMRGASAGFSAGTTALGLGPYITVDLGADYSRTHDVGTRGTYDGECLIACSYLPIYLERKHAEHRFTLGPWTLTLAKQGQDAEVEVGDEEVWRLGDSEAEGNMRATLAADGSDGHEEPAWDEGVSCAYAFVLLGYEDTESEDEAGDGEN